MRRAPWFALVLLLSAAPVRAAEPKCPYDVATCLAFYDGMRERPWLGVEVDSDSLGHRVVRSVVEGSPAARGGVRAGDVLDRIEGRAPAEWFAGRAGWKNKATLKLEVVRGGGPVALSLPAEHIPEERLARMIGIHMIEGHLAWGSEPEHH